MQPIEITINGASVRPGLQQIQANGGNDRLAPARGIMVGVLLSAVFWGLLLVIVT